MPPRQVECWGFKRTEHLRVPFKSTESQTGIIIIMFKPFGG
jgi:hypothetical protein